MQHLSHSSANTDHQFHTIQHISHSSTSPNCPFGTIQHLSCSSTRTHYPFFTMQHLSRRIASTNCPFDSIQHLSPKALVLITLGLPFNTEYWSTSTHNSLLVHLLPPIPHRPLHITHNWTLIQLFIHSLLITHHLSHNYHHQFLIISTMWSLVRIWV